ncbi:MAG: hypothetical protein ACRDGA_06415, partial [Bacteroidota bacterium]
MRKFVFRLCVLLLLAAFGSMVDGEMRGAEKRGDKNKASTPLPKRSVQEYQNFDGNRINNIMGNNGQYVSHVLTGNSGMEWPKGTFNLIDFAAGIWVAAKSGTQYYTAAAEYAVEYAPGVILPSGQPDDPTLAKYRWYKITRADLTNPGTDFLEWPVADGAPWVDVDGDGIYTAGVDRPNLVGDQMMWAVFNDANPALHGNIFGTPAMGLEVQMTVWGYNRPDAFGDMMFVKATVINKSNRSYDSTFIALWDDPDLGNAGDDYVGCDVDLSLGYCWNATNNDASYGAAPPAFGRDFFQGPIVPSPGDVANVSGRAIPNYKNLPMYSFAYYINGAPFPRQDPASAEEVFNYMTGKFQDGSPFVNPLTGEQTRFVFPGDPETVTGWSEVNPSVLAPGDRRYLMSSGPFTFAAGDTQEVVFGVIIARGNSNRNSVTVLKQLDAVAQLAYDLNFALPPSPPRVPVTVAELDKEVVLYWDATAESYSVDDLIDRDEDGNTTTYEFEGYIVYQLDAESGASNIKRLAVFDLVNDVKEIRDLVFDNNRGEQVEVTAVKGTDSGVFRTFRTTQDGIKGVPLVNNRTYYYAVTAYGYNPYGIPRMYEGPLVPITVIPHGPPAGTRYSAAFGDTIKNITHTGPSDASVLAFVRDPGQVTGHNYRVQFRTDATSGATVWDLVDVTAGQTVLASQTNQTGDEAFTIVHGIQVKVLGPASDVKDFQHVANPSGAISPPTYAAFGCAFNGWCFPDPTEQGAPVTDWGTGRWGIHTGGSGGGDESYEGRFKPRTFRGDNFSRFVPYDFEMRFTAAGGKGYMAFTSGAIVDVPFELWNIGISTPNDPSDDFRMIPLINDADGNGAFNLQQVDHGVSGGDNDPYTDWVYWYEPANKAAGSAGYAAWVASQSDNDIGDEVIARMVLVNVNGGSVADPTWPANATSLMPPTGNVIRIIATKPNT